MDCKYISIQLTLDKYMAYHFVNQISFNIHLDKNRVKNEIKSSRSKNIIERYCELWSRGSTKLTQHFLLQTDSREFFLTGQSSWRFAPREFEAFFKSRLHLYLPFFPLSKMIKDLGVRFSLTSHAAGNNF